MNQERLAEIQARCNAATPGPWFHEVTSDVQRVGPKIGNEHPYDGVGPTFEVWRKQPGRLEDLMFIAASRSDVPDLIAEVKRLRNIIVSSMIANANSVTKNNQDINRALYPD